MRTGFIALKTSRIRFSALAALSLVGRSASGAALQQNAPQQNAAPLPFVSPIFGDHMVLQRGKPNAIWGWSQPGDAGRSPLNYMLFKVDPASQRVWIGSRSGGSFQHL